MTTAAIEKSILLHELQLGEKLNQSIHDKRRSDFGLLLAMLAEDVREHSQFSLPATKLNEKQQTDSLLRKEFNLAEPAPIALKSLDDINLYNEAIFIENNELSHIKLNDALNPKPIVFRDDKNYIASDVMANTSLYCQTKHKENNDKGVIQKPMEFQAAAWIKAVDHQVTNDPLISTVA